MHHLRLGFIETLARVILKWNFIAISRRETICISLPRLSRRKQQQERWDGICLVLQSGLKYMFATDALSLSAVGMGMTFHVVALPLHFLLGTLKVALWAERACPSTCGEDGPDLSHFANKHHPTEVPLNKTASLALLCWTQLSSWMERLKICSP